MALTGSWGGSQLADQRCDVLCLEVLLVLLVNRDDGAPAAAAETLDAAQGDLAIGGRSRCDDAKLLLECAQHDVGANEGTGEIRADLDDVVADGLQEEHVVERSHGETVSRRQVEPISNVLERLGREPAVVLLRVTKRRQNRAAAVRILRDLVLDLGVEIGH